MTIEAIIFDIGGVLWRSNGLWLRDTWAARCGLADEVFDRIVFNSEWGNQALRGEISSAEKYNNIGARLGLTTQREIAELRDDVWSLGDWDAVLFEYIRTLKPNYRLGILSDASSDARKRIGEWVNEELFDVIVISAEERITKPDPRIYEITLQRLGVEPAAAVFIDDRPRNIAAAKQLGMHAILDQGRDQMLSKLEELLANRVSGFANPETSPKGRIEREWDKR